MTFHQSSTQRIVTQSSRSVFPLTQREKTERDKRRSPTPFSLFSHSVSLTPTAVSSKKGYGVNSTSPARDFTGSLAGGVIDNDRRWPRQTNSNTSQARDFTHSIFNGPLRYLGKTFGDKDDLGNNPDNKCSRKRNYDDVSCVQRKTD